MRGAQLGWKSNRRVIREQRYDVIYSGMCMLLPDRELYLTRRRRQGRELEHSHRDKTHVRENEKRGENHGLPFGNLQEHVGGTIVRLTWSIARVKYPPNTGYETHGISRTYRIEHEHGHVHVDYTHSTSPRYEHTYSGGDV